MTCKIVPDMTYNVFGGTLNLAQSINQSIFLIQYVTVKPPPKINQ